MAIRTHLAIHRWVFIAFSQVPKNVMRCWYFFRYGKNNEMRHRAV
jgi:hypothetical protein